MKNHRAVLIAEDDPDARAALDMRLRSAGFGVIAAAHGQAAIERFDEVRPDAAVVDIKMPGVDGLAVCQHIRQRGSDIPVFLLTGADEGVIRHHLPVLANTVGANHHVIKPYDGKLLVEMIREAIEHHACRQPA